MSRQRLARVGLLSAALTLVATACTSQATSRSDASSTSSPATTATTPTIGETTTSLPATTSVTPTALRSAEETVRFVIAALNEGDVAMTFTAFSPDALWDGFLGPTRLDDPLPDEILEFSAQLGLTQDATFRDMWAANFELLIAAQTVWTIGSCDTDGRSALCELRGMDAFTAISGIEPGAVFEIDTDDHGLIERFRFDPDRSGESSVRADDFRRWAKLERPDLDAQLDAQLDATVMRNLVELLGFWESQGSPAVEAPDPDLDAVAVVEAYLTARNDQNWETHVRLLGGDALDNPFGSYDEFLAAGALDRRIAIRECTVTALGNDSFVACLVDVTDIISAAAGRLPTNPNATTFAVRDGRVVDLPEFLPSLFLAEEAIEQWAVANEPERYATACPSGIAGQDVITGLSCAEFIAEFAEAWESAVAGAY